MQATLSLNRLREVGMPGKNIFFYVWTILFPSASSIWINEVLQELLETQSLKCTLTYITDHEILDLPMTQPVQVTCPPELISKSSLQMFNMNHGSSWQNIWSRHQCDTYVYDLNYTKIVSEESEILSLSQNGKSVWNFESLHIILSDGFSLQQLKLVIKSSHFRKSKKVVLLQHVNNITKLFKYSLYPRATLKRYYKVNKLIDDVDTRMEVNGAMLNVATFEHPPSVVYSQTDTGLVRLGVDMQLITTISKTEHFDIKFTEISHDELWGYKNLNGTWLGLVGELHYDKADLGVANVFMEQHRWELIDYSVPYNFERGCFVVPSPKPLPKSQAPLLPFKLDAWISTVVTLVISGLFLKLLYSLTVNNYSIKRSFSYWILYITAVISKTPPKKVPYLSLPWFSTISLWLGCVIISTMYSSNLIAFMTVTKAPEPINTLSGLKDSQLQIRGIEFWRSQFRTSVDPVVQEFAVTMEKTSSLKESLEMVEQGDIGLIENKQYLDLQIGASYTYGGKATIRIVEECLMPYSIAIAFPENSPLSQRFNDVILRIFESGVLGKWKEEVVSVFRRKHTLNKGRLQDDNMARALTLNNVEGMFYFLFIGLAFGIVTFIIESLITMWK